MNGHQIIHYNDVDLFHRQEQHKKQAKSFPVLLVLIGLGFLSLPVILVKLSNALRRKAAELQLDDAWENKLNVKARALSDFNGEDPQDLPFRKDQIINILSRPFPDWWEGETADGRRGLFPANFVKELPPPAGPENPNSEKTKG